MKKQNEHDVSQKAGPEHIISQEKAYMASKTHYYKPSLILMAKFGYEH